MDSIRLSVGYCTFMSDSGFQSCFNVLDNPANVLIALELMFNLVNRVQNGGVVLSSKALPYFNERKFGEVPAEVYGYLPGKNNLFSLFLRL